MAENLHGRLFLFIVTPLEIELEKLCSRENRKKKKKKKKTSDQNKKRIKMLLSHHFSRSTYIHRMFEPYQHST